MTNYRFIQSLTLRFAFACTLVLVGTLTLTAETKLAVIGGVDSGLNDLLTVQLSKARGITVLERQEFDAVIDEKTVRGLMKAEAGRNRMTAITGADFLVLLSRDKDSVRLVVAETNFGVTLESLSIPTQDKPTEKIVTILRDEVKKVVAEFSQGIQQIVAIPDFVSRDLTHDYDFLQTDYAEVIRVSFRQIPGLALVAVDEATAIANERDISGIEQEDRLIPVFIDGEYRTTHDPKSKATSVQITVRVKNSTKTLLHRKLTAVPIDQAGKRLLDVFSEDLRALIETDADQIDIDGQFKLLTERAEQFSDLGEIRRALALRESALLLKPDEADLRILLTHKSTKYRRVLTKGASKSVADQIVINNWKRSLRHCEYLIDNRQISGDTALSLSRKVIQSIYSIRRSSLLVECEKIRKQYIRHTLLKIPSLVSEAESKTPAYVCKAAINFALRPCDGPITSEDLDLVADLLVTDLPVIGEFYLFEFLQGVGRVCRGEKISSRFTAEEYEAFLDRLIASDRPLVQLNGRYGKLRCRYGMKQLGDKDWVAEAKAIIAAAKSAGVYEVCHGLNYALRVETLEAASFAEINRRPIPKPVPPVPPAPTTARLNLEPIELIIDNPNASSKNAAPWTFYRPLAKGLDAFWSKTTLMLSHQPGKLIPVLNDPKLLLENVVFDGQYVWVTDQKETEILLFDIDGKELARVGKDLGLPPCDTKYSGHYRRRGLIIHPLSPGRLLASGCFGPESRAWIAEIKFDGQSAKVNVFHEAVKVWESIKGNPGYRHYNTDPEICFTPQRMIEHVVLGDKPRRLIFITKDRGLNPMIVDAETLKVWCCQPSKGRLFPRMRSKAVINIDGLLYAPGYATFQTFRYDDKSGRFDVVREGPRQVVPSNRPSFNSLARDGKWLYYTGTFYWQRFNLKTGVEELLNDDEAALPKFVKNYGYHSNQYGRFPNKPAWEVFNSSHYGLVAEREGTLYRVRVKSPEEDAYAKPTE